jgi:hypothetical protein
MSLTSVIRYVRALDSAATDGSGKTGLAFGDITAKYLTQGGTLTALTTETITTLGTYQAPTDSAHIRIKELSSSDPCKGVYEVHFHNTQVAASGKKLWLFLSAAGAAFQPLELDLADLDGRLPAALGANGNLKADVRDFGGAAGTFSGGRPEVKVASLAAAALVQFVSDDLSLASVGSGSVVDMTVGAIDPAPTAAANAAAVWGAGARTLTAFSLTVSATLGTDAVTAAAVSAGAVTKIQAGLATPTNITAATGVVLAAAGLDAVLIESAIAASAALVNDAGTQLTAINARQALAAILSSVAAVLSGAATTAVAVKPAGKPAAADRIDATVTADGDRTAVNLRVPT